MHCVSVSLPKCIYMYVCKCTHTHTLSLSLSHTHTNTTTTPTVLSTLPKRFAHSGTLAGTVFVDIFDQRHVPLEDPSNVGMVYAVGPEGTQADSAEDFLAAVKYAGKNLGVCVCACVRVCVCLCVCVCVCVT